MNIRISIYSNEKSNLDSLSSTYVSITQAIDRGRKYLLGKSDNNTAIRDPIPTSLRFGVQSV